MRTSGSGESRTTHENRRVEQILLATRSPGKIRELRHILGGIEGIELIGLEEWGIDPREEEDELEVFSTFRENAIAKARYFAGIAGIPAIADDSGLAVDFLDGAPGVHSKRFAVRRAAAHSGETPIDETPIKEPTGSHTTGSYITAGHPTSDDDLDQANNQHLLEMLRGVPWEERGAHFATAAAIATPDQKIITAIGTASGMITEEPRGSAGFGYDPIFLIPELGRTFAELSSEEKNRHSHRARAFHALRAQYRYLLRND